MKQILIITLLSAVTSCSSIKQIGDLNMISKRNINLDEEYTQLRTYAGSSSNRELKKEFSRVKSTSIDMAVDHTVRNTPGGEFLTNVKIYTLNGEYFVVQGDVWGIAGKEIDYKGWKVGDRVQFKKGFNTVEGSILDLKNSEEATVKDSEGNIISVKYDRLTKIGTD